MSCQRLAQGKSIDSKINPSGSIQMPKTGKNGPNIPPMTRKKPSVMRSQRLRLIFSKFLFRNSFIKSHFNIYLPLQAR